ncbi:MAG: hypothetical protein EBU90_07815 [Proteobacteria bacterium]|nr:hypothetical protein [Pseudomonadota bacterium]NBP14105.1 hypothetical protein [bacterium]
MPITFTDKLIVYLTLLTGLSISAVAIYYSVAGLAAIFSAAVIPIIIMGVILEIGKLVATVWLKQNWKIAPYSLRIYLLAAIFLLMFITSMGIFGFLSKAHSDQNLVGGEVLSKIAMYDEKIKIAKENIDASRKALKQMDDAVDQTMGRSTSEQGADKAIQVRRSQARERTRLLQDIESEQRKIAELNEAKAPIAVEVRKVEAEVGPIKYIAKLLYDDNPDANILEKAVSWVIIMIVVVFDPLAVVLLLASQITFAHMREQQNMSQLKEPEPAYEPDDGPLTDDQIEQIKESAPQPVYQSYLYKPWIDRVPGIRVPPQVYKAPVEETKEKPLFVQNEEQAESNTWSKTNEVIGSSEYLKEGLTRQEVTLFEWIDKIKSGKATIHDVPRHMLSEIKARM